MVLQFNPPQDLVNAYLNRPSPGQIASESVNQALQTYAQQKAAQQQQALAQQQKDIEMAKGLSSGGQDFLDALTKIRAQRAVPQTPSPQGPSLIDRAKAFFGGSPAPTSSPLVSNPDTSGMQSTATPAPQMSVPPPVQSTGTVSGITPSIPPVTPITKPGGPTTDPLIQEYMQDPVAFKQRHGTQGIEKLKTQMEIDKGIQDKSKGPLQTLTKEQALANGTYDPSKQYLIEPPPSKADQGEKLSDKQLSDAQKAYNSDKNREKAEAVIDKVSQAAPLLQAGSIDNATAKQALQTAMTYMATGGMRVNEVELRQFGGANALTNKMAQWYKGLDAGTLTARDAKDMGNVLNIFQQAAQQNLQNIGLRHTRQYLQRSQSGEKESDAYAKVTGTDFSPPSEPTVQRPTITSQAQYDALPQGAKYQDSNGVPHTKGLR